MNMAIDTATYDTAIIDATQHLMTLFLPVVVIIVIGGVMRAFINRAPREYVPAPKLTVVPIADVAAQPTAEHLWDEAVEIADDLAKQVADYEFDLDQRYFQRPLLADPAEPRTAAWLEAKEAMDTALSRRPLKDLDEAAEVLAAAERAREAWTTAWRHAGIVGLGTLEAEDRRRMHQAQKILARAADQATTEAERATCIDRIVAILSEVAAVDRFTIRRSITTHISAQLSIAPAAPQAAITAGQRSDQGHRRAI